MIKELKYYVYISSSFLGLLPEITIYIFLGTTIKNVTEALDSETGKTQWIIIGVQLGVTVILLVCFAIFSKKVWSSISSNVDQIEEIDSNLNQDTPLLGEKGK